MKHYPVRKNKSATWCAVAFCLTVASAFAQSVISLNFDGQDGTGTPGAVTGVAGSVPAGNWNNTGTGNGGNVGNGVALVDDSGAATGATVNWSGANHWTTNGGDSNGGDAQMMQGYLDNFHDQPPIEVNGIPASFQGSGYELRIYHNTDSAGTMGFTVDDGSGPVTYYSHQTGGNGSNYPLAGADEFGGAVGYIGSQDTNAGTTTPSNYTLFTGLTGSSLTITGVRGAAGDTRSRPNGFQIVATGAVTDEDGDGLADNWETANGLDPADDGSVDINNGPAGDPDNDGSANLEEFERGTDPQSDDTDDDGLLDGVESGSGTFVSETDTGTDPLEADSDGDGLVDGAEVAADPFVTDPNNPDTDADGVNDGTEIAGESDPTDPDDVPGGGVIGGVISLNFDGQDGTGTPGPVTGVAGSIPVGNWNNTGTGNGANVGNGVALVDGNGAATGATVNWSVANHWTTNGGDSNGGDAQMMQGYLDNFHDRPPIEVNGIPGSFQASGYELRIYHNTDSGGTMGFTVDDGSGPVTYYSHQAGGNGANFPLAGVDPFGGAAGYIGSQDTNAGTTTPSNYTLFTGLTGASLTIQGVRGAAGDTRSRPNGFQIVSTAPPADEDGDRLDDSWETANGLDPADDGSVDINNGAAGDPDNDGSANLEEFERGTDPQSDDTDDDGLLDGAETGTGTFVSETDTGTGPLDPDSDGDGLADGAEVAADPFVTDPNTRDTDGDGVSDAIELELGTDPTDGNSLPRGTGNSIGINFNSNRDLNAELAPDEVAGFPAVAQGNWNNTAGGGDAVAGASGTEADLISPAAGSLVDSNGVPSGVTVSWASNGTWSTTNGTADHDAKLMNGYIDNIGAGGFCTIDLSGIPYVVYDVYVYFGSDGNGRTGWVESTTAGQTFSFTTFSNAPGGAGFGPSDYILTEDEANGHPNSNYCVFRDQSGSDFSVQVNRGSSNSGIHAIQIVGTVIPEVKLIDVNHDAVADTTELTWESAPGQVFEIGKSLDLTGDPAAWPRIISGIQAGPGETTTVTVDTAASETEAFYKVFQIPAPPIFEDDFETDTGWTAIVNDANGNTNWERGAPNGSTGPLSGADDSANAWSTNLGDYGVDSDISLRSPAIDLTGVSAAELNFEAFRDADGFGDTASVRFLRASDQVQLGAEIPIDMTAFDANWIGQTIPVEVEAIGESVIIEFNFVSDSSPDAFSGLSIDNIVVSVP